MTTAYDDPEQMLQDQGLEVVVVPYRPPPSHGKSTRRRRSDSRPPKPEFASSTSQPSRQLVTPRSQLAMVEAVCQDVDGTPMHPLKAVSPKRKVNDDVDPNEQLQRQAQSQQRASARATQNHSQTQHPRRQHRQSSSFQRSDPTFKSKKHHRKLSYLQLAKLGYQELVHAIIRPPRSKYELQALGPTEFSFCDVNFTRKDFYVRNHRGMKIQCSLWSCGEWDLDQPQSEREEMQIKSVDSEDASFLFTGKLVLDDWDENNERGRMYLQLNEDTAFGEEDMGSSSSSSFSSDLEQDVSKGKDVSGSVRTASLSFSQCTINDGQQYSYEKSSTSSSASNRPKQRHSVVIYMHGNSSSRLEVIPQLGHLLSLGVSVLSFDFCGSGHSDGEYVSLGYHEREDLDAIIKFLRGTGQVSSIGLWGRSMGAATALMYASRDPTIACMILDSSFTDLHRLVEELVEKGRKQGVAVPNLVLQVVMRLIKSSVKATAGFSLRHISPISHADICFVPAMFVAGEHDDFINKRHSILIHQKYAGDKNISIVDGDHNSPRPRFLQQSACLFLQSVMRLPASNELVVPMGMNLLIPPWLSNKGARSNPVRERRPWLPARQKYQQRAHTTSESEVLEFSEEHGLQRKKEARQVNRSTHSDHTVVATCQDEVNSVLAAAAPPDMNVRQNDIQASLFKMLGKSDA